MKKLLCLLAIIICVFFTSVSFAASADEIKDLEIKAAQGDAEMQFLLGSMYVSGEDVSPDYVKAAEWFEKSAIQGFAEAQFILGFMYHGALGISQDYAAAKEWYKKACDNGYQLGCNAFKELNKAGF